MHETAIQHVNSPAHLSIWSCSPAADLAAWHCHLQCEAQISFLPPGHGLLLLCSTSDTHQALPWKFNLLNEQKKLWGCFCFIHPPQGVTSTCPAPCRWLSGETLGPARQCWAECGDGRAEQWVLWIWSHACCFPSDGWGKGMKFAQNAWTGVSPL